jgi:hypothetical protein
MCLELEIGAWSGTSHSRFVIPAYVGFCLMHFGQAGVHASLGAEPAERSPDLQFWTEQQHVQQQPWCQHHAIR